jgi:hypothetical protein
MLLAAVKKLELAVPILSFTIVRLMNVRNAQMDVDSATINSLVGHVVQVLLIISKMLATVG